jgi:hypothetical protein
VLIASYVISLAALLIALTLLHRLVALEVALVGLPVGTGCSVDRLLHAG